MAAQALQRIGYNQVETWVKEHSTLQASTNIAHIELLSKHATIPTKGSAGSVGYDVRNPGPDITLLPQETKVIQLDLALTPPPGHYTRIAPRSGLTVKNRITVMAGVIDPDYTGNIGVVLHNFGSHPQSIKQNQKIAQLLFESITCPRMKSVPKLKTTRRANKGYGSTDIEPSIHSAITNAHTTITSDLNLNFELPYTINLSSDPFEYTTTRSLKTNSQHPTLGLHLTTCSHYHKPKLQACQPGTPAAHLSNWRSELQNAYVLSINNTPVTSINDIKDLIHTYKRDKHAQLNVKFGTSRTHSIHPQLGVPQIYHDQLDVIGKHLWNLSQQKHHRKWTPIDLQQVTLNNNTKKILPRHVIRKLQHVIKSSKTPKKPKKLTRRYLQQQEDWLDWWKSEHKQLEQYQEQNTFSKPQPYPKGANLLNLLWTYLIKDDGRKKARCVCNGSPKMGGTVTLGETYATSLDQTAARIFWAVSALKNMTVIGADASNAFAEAPPPIAPLFVTIDKTYREWWKAKGRPPIPADCLLKVLV